MQYVKESPEKRTREQYSEFPIDFNVCKEFQMMFIGVKKKKV